MRPIISLLIIILSIVTLFLYIGPTYTEIEELSIQKSNFQEAHRQADVLAQEREEKESEYRVLQAGEGGRLAKMIPAERDDSRTLMTLETIANNNGTTMRDISIQDGRLRSGRRFSDSEPDSFGAKTVRFTIRSSYNNFINLISDLERSLRLFDVVEVSFSSTDEAGVYDFNLAVQSYWAR